MESVAKKPELAYDAIVVDEGQDFKELFWMALESILKVPLKGTFYIFYDDNQAIFCDTLSIPADFPRFSLHDNIRNTKTIFKLVSRFHPTGIEIKSKGPEGREVEAMPYKTKEEFLKNMSKTLHRLTRDEGIPEESITVLSMKSVDKEGRSYLSDGIKAGNFTLTKNPAKPDEIRLSNVYSYKGLENKVIIITDIDDYICSDPKRKSTLCYVGFSRPRNHLILMGREGALESIVSSVDFPQKNGHPVKQYFAVRRSISSTRPRIPPGSGSRGRSAVAAGCRKSRCSQIFQSLPPVLSGNAPAGSEPPASCGSSPWSF